MLEYVDFHGRTGTADGVIERNNQELIQMRRERHDPNCAEPNCEYRTKPRGAESTCSRDHCTPEERAVIEAAIKDREAARAYDDLGGPALRSAHIEAVDRYRVAVSALLTTRKEQG